MPCPLIHTKRYISLDYAKTSHFGTAITSRTTYKEPPAIVLTPSGFASLVEDGIEAIVAGQHYQRSDFDPSGRASHGSNTIAGSGAAAGPVTFSLSIDRQTPGILESQSGSWRRILINLCGNALKYTQFGFVHVSLTALTTPATSDLPAQKHILFVVSDSGIGMSQEYLKYKLFTPFAQENPLSAGTGLGLSIVRQIVADLGGNIDVQSELGYGTTVKVSVPVSDYLSLTSSGSGDPGSIVTDMRTRCKGLVLSLVGFDYLPDIREEPTGILGPQARSVLVLKSSITQIASEWFGMKVTTAPSLANANGEVIVCLRSKWDPLEKHAGALPLVLVNDITDENAHQVEGVFSLPHM